MGINPKTGAEEKRTPDATEPLAGLAFKIQIDPHVGKLTYYRVYSGTITAGSYIYNSYKKYYRKSRPYSFDARQSQGRN